MIDNPTSSAPVSVTQTMMPSNLNHDLDISPCRLFLPYIYMPNIYMPKPYQCHVIRYDASDISLGISE
jgi:hypothetical protein